MTYYTPDIYLCSDRNLLQWLFKIQGIGVREALTPFLTLLSCMNCHGNEKGPKKEDTDESLGFVNLGEKFPL